MTFGWAGLSFPILNTLNTSTLNFNENCDFKREQLNFPMQLDQPLHLKLNVLKLYCHNCIEKGLITVYVTKCYLYIVISCHHSVISGNTSGVEVIPRYRVFELELLVK